MIINETIKRAFAKDYNLPISIFSEEHFIYSLQQLDKYYNSVQSYKYLSDYLNKLEITCDNPCEIFTVFNKKIIDTAIDRIKCTESYKDFISMDMTPFKHNLNISKSNQLYKSENHEKTFVSIDLVKANFQALKYVNSDIVLGYDNYNDFLSKLTEFDYHLKSKKMRQVIFGNLNPKRQQTIQKHIMEKLTKQLIDLGLEESDILNCTSDELIFEYKEEYSHVIEKLNNKSILPNIDFHVELFVLYRLLEDKPYYYKKDLNHKITLKGIPNHSILESIKYIEGNDIEKKDLQFMFEGRLCEFSSSIYK